MNLFRLTHRAPLIQEAQKDTEKMLELGQDVFRHLTQAWTGETDPDQLEELKKQDKLINSLHRGVRKKVYEHLSLTGNESLFAALVLLSIVDDSERIGDYGKNIAELISFNPGRLDFGKYQETFERVWNQSTEMFENTIKAIRDDDEKSALKVMEAYVPISNTVDDLIERMFKEESGDTIKREYVALMLLMRYFKRVDAHLKNIASTVVNPFHRIGYKAKSK